MNWIQTETLLYFILELLISEWSHPQLTQNISKKNSAAKPGYTPEVSLRNKQAQTNGDVCAQRHHLPFTKHLVPSNQNQTEVTEAFNTTITHAVLSSPVYKIHALFRSESTAWSCIRPQFWLPKSKWCNIGFNINSHIITVNQLQHLHKSLDLDLGLLQNMSHCSSSSARVIMRNGMHWANGPNTICRMVLSKPEKVQSSWCLFAKEANSCIQNNCQQRCTAHGVF